MSEFKHTPGPWVVNPLQLNQICTKENPKEIAKACVSPHAGITLEQAIANAQLMAASEQMLNALRRAALALAFASETSEAMHDDYKAVCEAIAAATGVNHE